MVSNLTSRTDARGVKTVYSYNNDPLNRLQSISWDTSGFGDTNNPILAAATVSYTYRAKSFGTQLLDVTQLASVTTAGVSTESYSFDIEGRVSAKTLTVASRSGYPFQTDYNYDSLDRVWRVWYPAEYGNGAQPRKTVQHTFDVASRLSSLTFDGQTQASNIVYNAASQTTSLSVGTGTDQVNEGYSYNAQTGLLDGQTVTRNGSPLLNLSYDYAGANGKRTGQLTRIYNNLAPAKNRRYEYDALGRLIRATGGEDANVTWAQRYEYDRYGNRSNAYSYVLEDYVKNFYQSALNRQPNSNELNSWLTSLRSAYLQGQWQFRDEMRNLGSALFTSQEYINRGRTNEQFVYDLYKAFLYREPDPDGYAYWVSVVPTNGRDNVRLGFELSVEFYTKVFGTSPYTPAVTIPRDGLQGIAFDQATNRIANAGWNYDAAGNQTRTQSNGVWQRFQYDAANRLVRVKADDNVTVLASYTYGEDNQRLITEESGTRTYFVAEGLSVLAEYVESGSATNPAWSKSYVYLGNRLLSTMTPNGIGGEAAQYHHPDRLGTRIITNPSTGSSSEQVTLPFGTALAAESSGTPTTRRFTSYDRSGTSGLDYAVNRHYDSQQGRFTQVDPAGMKATTLDSPQTLNLYSYCANDPVNGLDPDGLGLLSFLKKAFKYALLGLAAFFVAGLVLLAVTTVFSGLGAFLIAHPMVLAITAGLLGIISQHFVLTVYNAIADEIREHGFSLGSLFRGFGKGLGRFFKSLIRPTGLLGIAYYGNYCGAGNPNQSSGRDPIDELDAACRDHDRVYQDANADAHDRARADLRFARAAARAGLRGMLSRTGNLFALFVAVGFFFKGLLTLLFTSSNKSSAQPTTISVSENGGSRVRFRIRTRDRYQIEMPSYREIMNAAPYRIDRFSIGLGGT